MYEFVSEVTLSSDATSIEISNIPSDSTGLEIWLKYRLSSNTNLEATINNDTNTADYDSQRLFTTNASQPQALAGDNNKLLISTTKSAAQNEAPAILRVVMPEYANSAFGSKSIMAWAGSAQTNAQDSTNHISYLRYIGGTINRFKVAPQGGNLLSGTKMSLYKKVGE